MSRRWIAAWLGAALAGTALHFLHNWLPNPLTALFAPVNESVWEHLKLLFWPYLGAAWLLVRREEHPWQAWTGHLAALLVMPLILLGAHYALRSGFSMSGLEIDLTLYYLTLTLGFVLAYHTGRSPRAARLAGPLLLTAAVYAVLLTVFTFAAPALPVFEAP